MKVVAHSPAVLQVKYTACKISALYGPFLKTRISGTSFQMLRKQVALKLKLHLQSNITRRDLGRLGSKAGAGGRPP